MENTTQELIIYSTIVLFIFCLAIPLLFVIFQTKKTKLILKANALEKEVLTIENQVKENTMNEIARELHDNLGQKLTLLKLKTYQIDQQEYQDFTPIINDCIKELRAISKQLSGKDIQELGITKSIEREIQKIKSIGMECDTKIDEINNTRINTKHQLILFRIFQEIINNALKHSQASKLSVNLTQQGRKIILNISDNGKGFDSKKISQGLGLQNLKKRSELIGADFKMVSEINKGTTHTIIYKS